MLSNLLVTKQKVVLIIDELNRERIALRFIDSLLHEQGQEAGTIKTLPIGNLRHVSSYQALLNECGNNNNNNNNNNQSGEAADFKSVPATVMGASTKAEYNVILPTLADLLCYQTPAYIFSFLNRLRRSEHVRRVFLWASPQHLQHHHAQYILAGCEYLAELILRLETETLMSLISRKPGGGVSNKRYACQVTKTEFHVTPLDGPAAVGSPKQPSPEADQTAEPASSTFKIELDEDEVVARNALTLPYERTSEPAEGNIIYTPDADDDFDDEDPDEDLCI